MNCIMRAAETMKVDGLAVVLAGIAITLAIAVQLFVRANSLFRMKP